MTTIWNNDYARAFFKDHGYPEQYNDGMLAWLREVYGVTGSTLPDLLARYLEEYGEDFNMRVLDKSAVPISLVEPAATFTATTPTNGGGGTIVLTSAGAHGLTTAIAVGKSIYISGGTGWVVGFYPITAIDLNTTGVAITITGNFDIGLGSPVIALANTEVPLAKVSIPPLSVNSYIDINLTTTATSSSNSKRYRIKLEGTDFFNVNTTTSPNLTAKYAIHNRNSTSSQVGSISTTSNSGFGASVSAPATGTINTSVVTTLTISVQPSVANEVVILERYVVELNS